MFKEKGFQIVKNAIKPQTLSLLTIQFKMMEQCEYFYKQISNLNSTAFQDEQVPFSFPWYGSYWSESLMVLLQPKVEEIIGKALYPCYTYARIMHKGAVMKKHKDRPSCQYSATICLSEDKDSPYPIFIEDYEDNVHSVHLSPGDMLIYNGTELNHWREEYQGKEQMQCFIHFVDSNGPYADYKYDKRPMLGLGK